jgi:hypothetical protein
LPDALTAFLTATPFVYYAWVAPPMFAQGNRIGEGLLGDRLPSPIKLKSGAASFNLWGDWQDGAVSRVVGQVDLTEPFIAEQKACTNLFTEIKKQQVILTASICLVALVIVLKNVLLVPTAFLMRDSAIYTVIYLSFIFILES